MIKKEDLPKITKQEKAFVEHLALGKTQIDAYKSSYSVENMNDNSIRVEACRVAKRSDVQLWLEYFEQNIKNGALAVKLLMPIKTIIMMITLMNGC